MHHRLLACLSVAVALIPAAAQAQRGVGAKFGARDPRTCATLKDPARGAITADQAKRYFICESELVARAAGGGDLLYLVSDVNIEVGKGRPFLESTDAWPNIDPAETVYPIRGSYVVWQCVPLGAINGEPGQNCSRSAEPHATGICYKDTFRDWHCEKFMDINTVGDGMKRYPPPKQP
jgi:hypothetical protein